MSKVNFFQIDSRSVDAESAGGKALGLHRLIAAGYRVPPAIVVPPDAAVSTETCQEIAEGLISRITGSGLSRERFAVRSSAAIEDGSEASFAGQFRSELNVEIDELAESILRCRDSGRNTANLRSYSDSVGGNVSGEPIPVVVQPMVEARYAGVVFTCDPRTMDAEVAVLELVDGLGDGLVSGLKVPLHYRAQAGALEASALPEWATENLRPELDSIALDVISLASLAAAELGYDADIEFAIDVTGEVWLLQARPVTRASSVPTEPAPDLAFDIEAIVSAPGLRLVERYSHLDKVRIRLVAARAGLRIGRGWLIEVRERAGAGPSSMPDALSSCPQVSLVLQDPPKVQGEIQRRFTTVDNRLDGLAAVASRALVESTSPVLIATEILSAELSGIAQLVGDRVLVEVGYGSFIPKGVSVTSSYVLHPDGTVVDQAISAQPTAVVIHDGRPMKVAEGRSPQLDVNSLELVSRAVLAASAEYESPSVEFGVSPDGEFFVIDFVEDSSGADHADYRPSVVSEGQFVGRVLRAEDEDLLDDAIEAHFHSERAVDAGEKPVDPVVVVAPLPYLSLERLITEHAGNLAFVFEHCSYLAHLSIVLRERRIPAVVVGAEARDLSNGALLEIDTRNDRPFRVVG